MVTAATSGAIAQLVTAIQVSIAGAEKAAIELELRHAIREFCVRSNAWTSFIQLTTKAGKTLYSLSPPDNEAEISTIIAVTVDGRAVAGWSGDYLPNSSQNAGPHYITNPSKLVESTINTLQLDSSYTTVADKALVITASFRPRRDLLFIPDMLGFDFFDVLQAGCEARLKRHAGRPYSDMDDAYTQRRYFMAGLTRAREKTAARFGKLTIPWVYPQAAPGRRYGR